MAKLTELNAKTRTSCHRMQIKMRTRSRRMMSSCRISLTMVLKMLRTIFCWIQMMMMALVTISMMILTATSTSMEPQTYTKNVMTNTSIASQSPQERCLQKNSTLSTMTSSAPSNSIKQSNRTTTTPMHRPKSTSKRESSTMSTGQYSIHLHSFKISLE